LASYKEMLEHFGYKSMLEFMQAVGLYNLVDAKRMLVAMYEDDTAPSAS
jgi:hypothetical protein